ATEGTPMADPRQTLTQVERDQLETYVARSTASPIWPYQLGIAVAGGSAVASGDVETGRLAIFIAVGAAAAIGALYALMLRRSGVNPRLRSMPALLRRVLIGYWIVAALIVGPTLIWAFSTEGEWVFTRAGAVVAVVTGFGGILADRIYERFARRLAESAGIGRG